ncbi:hypothetical protein KC19_5G030900 [Ceratodon purpureus]|uniref:Uncharacterized protein n=1 Tax=Ceratodon purpureus TaxID=3225 RepID=A0A8T0HXG0_CERPU|nr:hypothetical protein KC19_5G030900 [Ceratodon purpureus]
MLSLVSFGLVSLLAWFRYLVQVVRECLDEVLGYQLSSSGYIAFEDEKLGVSFCRFLVKKLHCQVERMAFLKSEESCGIDSVLLSIIVSDTFVFAMDFFIFELL